MKKIFFTSILLCAIASSAFTLHAQTRQECVVDRGTLKIVDTEYDRTTGNYTVTIAGKTRPFDEVYPPGSKDYAANNAWYKTAEPILYNGEKYLKSRYPHFLEPADFKKVSDHKGVGVYTDAGSGTVPDILYLPSNRGGEFQEYHREKSKLQFRKMFYDENWRITTEPRASYTRNITLNAAGQPAGKVRDFYANGKMQWEGYISYLDSADNSNDVMEGVATWYHPNGKKAEQVYMIRGKREGLYRAWEEDGTLVQQTEYKEGLMHGYHYVYGADGKLAQRERYLNGSLVRE